MNMGLLGWALLGVSTLQPAPSQDLCITSGHLNSAPESMLSVQDPRMRAVLRYMTPTVAELRFKYRGAANASFAFSSGISRQQIGLKLRAKDPCNLLYVMWRITPKPEVVVSLKSNPTQHTSSVCGGTGYHNIKALRAAPPPPVSVDTDHRLRAELIGSLLTVRADSTEVWQGTVGEEASRLQGPVGVRTDNGRFDLQLMILPTLSRVPLGDEDVHGCHMVDAKDVVLDDGNSP